MAYVQDVESQWTEKGIIAHLVLKKIGYIVKKIEIFIEKIIYAQSAGKIRFPVRKKSVLNAERKECLGKSH